MPYVTIPAVSRTHLLDSAGRRWQAVGASRPDLEPALRLQRQLLTLVIDLAVVLDGGRLPKLSLPPKYLAAKLARGVPVLAGEPIPLPVPVLTPTLLRLCDALAAGGAGEAATHIRETIESGNIEPGSLLTASLNRDQAAVRIGAVHRGLSPDLVQPSRASTAGKAASRLSPPRRTPSASTAASKCARAAAVISRRSMCLSCRRFRCFRSRTSRPPTSTSPRWNMATRDPHSKTLGLARKMAEG